jgi:hypothetical protein
MPLLPSTMESVGFGRTLERPKAAGQPHRSSGLESGNLACDWQETTKLGQSAPAVRCRRHEDLILLVGLVLRRFVFGSPM